MGRKRKGWAQERKPITVSLPRQMIIDLDNTLNEDQARSKLFERLARNYLRTNTKLSDFGRHLYHCDSCHREWHMNRKVETVLLICAGETGCGSDKISYCGVLKEEEE